MEIDLLDNMMREEIMEIDLLDNPMFHTHQQVIDHIMMENEGNPDVQHFMDCPFDELIHYHHTLGRSIRNTYNLWYNTELCNNCNDGDAKPTHPEDASQYIIEKLWIKLNKDSYHV